MMNSSPYTSYSSTKEIAHVSFLVRFFRSLGRVYSSYLDKTTVYIKTRWLFVLILLGLYAARIYYIQSFHLVTYALGIYLLNILIGVISPQIDPESETGLSDGGNYSLPMKDSGEFRPFQRRLPEFKAWLSSLKAICLSIILTFFDLFDLPVFWPILLIYFIILFFLTLKEQIKKMIKYRYIPLSLGKQTYGDITRTKNKAKGAEWSGGAVISASSHHILSPSVPKHLQQNNNAKNSASLQTVTPAHGSASNNALSHAAQKQSTSLSSYSSGADKCSHNTSNYPLAYY